MNFFKRKSKKPKDADQEANQPVSSEHGKVSLPDSSPLAKAKQEADKQARQKERSKEKGLPKFAEFEFGKSNKRKGDKTESSKDELDDRHSWDGCDQTLRAKSTANTRGGKSSSGIGSLATPPRPTSAAYNHAHGRYRSEGVSPAPSNENHERSQWRREGPDSRGYYRGENWESSRHPPPHGHDQYRAHTPLQDGQYPERHSFSHAGEYGGTYYDQKGDPFPSLYQPPYAPPSPRPDSFHQPPRPISHHDGARSRPVTPSSRGPHTPQRYDDAYYQGPARSATWDDSYYNAGPPPIPSSPRCPSPYLQSHSTGAYSSYSPSPQVPYGGDPYNPRHSVYSHNTGVSYMSGGVPPPPPPPMAPGYDDRRYSQHMPYSPQMPHDPHYPHTYARDPYDRQPIAPQHTNYSGHQMHPGARTAPYPDPRIAHSRHWSEPQGLPNPHDPAYRAPPSPLPPKSRELEDPRRSRMDDQQSRHSSRPSRDHNAEERNRSERDLRAPSRDSLKSGSEASHHTNDKTPTRSRNTRQSTDTYSRDGHLADPASANGSPRAPYSKLVKRKPAKMVEAEQKKDKEEQVTAKASRLSIYHTPSFSRSRESFDFSPVATQAPELDLYQAWERSQEQPAREENPSWTDRSQGIQRVESPESMQHQSSEHNQAPSSRPYSRTHERSTTPYSHSEHRSVSEFDHSSVTSPSTASNVSSYNANSDDQEAINFQHELYHLSRSKTRPNVNGRPLPAPSPKPRRQQQRENVRGRGVEESAGHADTIPASGPVESVGETESTKSAMGASSSTSHPIAIAKRTKTMSSPKGPRVRSRSVSAALADAEGAV